MKITAISDLHGEQPELPGGDLLLIAGDITARDHEKEWKRFSDWMHREKKHYGEIVLVAGNHDLILQQRLFPLDQLNCVYLEDSGFEYQGVKIWGTPYSLSFAGMNPTCTAFTCQTEKELAEHFEKIPQDVDILISHTPPLHIFDLSFHMISCGSSALRNAINRVDPRLCIFGHIHECGGKIKKIGGTIYANVAHLDFFYEEGHNPLVAFDLEFGATRT